MPSQVSGASLALFDPLLSYGSIMLFAVMAALTARDLRGLRQGRLLLLVLLSQMGLALIRSPAAGTLPTPLLIPAEVIALPNLGLLWWFCLSLLRDDFRIAPAEWIGFGVLSIIPLAYLIEAIGFTLPFSGGIAAFGDVPPLLMIVHIVWVALSERGDDMVEPRRRARLWLTIAPLVALLIALPTEAINDQAASVIRNGIGILPAQLVLLFWLARLHPAPLLFEPAVQPPRIAAKNDALHTKLMRVMNDDRVYLRHGLTIGALADMLGSPPHQLRHLINAELGFRNFAAFLNSYRLDHAKAALADVVRARETILSIAYESGFASLPSFNRAFREHEGKTPTGFRSTALEQHGRS